ncbi:hypothetical protein MHB47_13100 [Staphylococcus sp. FSL K6-3157]|uniref:hypothetical protein n=1 Tax=Staphylococcus sp. FSL K6-3157 TaxID=2921490 RepID=UPI0030F66288
MGNNILLQPGKLEEVMNNLMIEGVKENNNNLQPIEITYDSELSNAEIDSIILKLNNINNENNILINKLLKHKLSR